MIPYFHYSAYTTCGVCIIDCTSVRLSISYFSASLVIYLLELFHGSLPINTGYYIGNIPTLYAILIGTQGKGIDLPYLIHAFIQSVYSAYYSAN